MMCITSIDAFRNLVDDLLNDLNDQSDLPTLVLLVLGIVLCIPGSNHRNTAPCAPHNVLMELLPPRHPPCNLCNLHAGQIR